MIQHTVGSLRGKKIQKEKIEKEKYYMHKDNKYKLQYNKQLLQRNLYVYATSRNYLGLDNSSG